MGARVEIPYRHRWLWEASNSVNAPRWQSAAGSSARALWLSRRYCRAASSHRGAGSAPVQGEAQRCEKQALPGTR